MRDGSDVPGATAPLELLPASASPRPVHPGLAAAFLLLALLLLGAAGTGLWLAWPSDAPPPAPTQPHHSGMTLPIDDLTVETTPPPKVEPVQYLGISPDDARRANTLVPFAKGPNPPAPPFRFTGDAGARARALTCLAGAAYYEAGDDPIGQAAVIQVVLNRVRHPAFPASVCGVVFEGAERATGCQFTFACDGALGRKPAPALWARARANASAALDGLVFRPVGVATHYHTDWVVPKWGPEFDKVTAIHTHLFFRWKGGWGKAAALRQAYAGPEALDPRIAGLASPVVGTTGVVDPALTVALPAAAVATPAAKLPIVDGGTVRLFDPVRSLYLVQLDPAAFPGSYAVLAWTLCKEKSPCRVAGWASIADVPASLPLGVHWRDHLLFFYERSGAGGQTSQWDCGRIERTDKSQCLEGSAPAK